jgi:protein gp37
MAKVTEISWTDSTWSPIRARVKLDAPSIAKAKGYTSLVEIAMKMRGRVGQHCEHVSPGCEHCYAGTNNHRCLPGNGTGLPYDRRSRDLVEAFVDEKVLLQPLKWGALYLPCDKCGSISNRDCLHTSRETRPRRIFVENQSDLFGEWVTYEMLDRVFAVMALCPQHIFQVLTKRPELMLEYSFGRELRGLEWPLPNVWLGVSVENQSAADERIPLLLETLAAVRFVSCEPLLGAVEFSDVTRCSDCIQVLGKPAMKGIDWVIAGGESGPGARPMDPSWARSLCDQCTAAGVPFFMKQMGSVFGPSKGHDLPAGLNIKQFPRVL